MTNYTTETYQMKRESLNFSNKISNGWLLLSHKLLNLIIQTYYFVL